MESRVRAGVIEFVCQEVGAPIVVSVDKLRRILLQSFKYGELAVAGAQNIGHRLQLSHRLLRAGIVGRLVTALYLQCRIGQRDVRPAEDDADVFAPLTDNRHDRPDGRKLWRGDGDADGPDLSTVEKVLKSLGKIGDAGEIDNADIISVLSRERLPPSKFRD